MELPMLLVVLLGSSIYAQDGEVLDNSAPKYLRRPPSITQGPEKHYIYVTDSTLTLPCEASGDPAPEFLWMKDNVDVRDLHRNPPIDWNEGTITLNSLTSLDEGSYQCFAKNQYGKSMSIIAMLNKALIGNYPPDVKIEEKTATRGEKLKLICDDLKIYPEGSFTWVTAETVTGAAGDQPVTLGPRIQMDDKGNLFFANVVDGDGKDGWLYKCNIYNSHLVITKGGSFTRVTVNPGSPPPKRPLLEFQTSSPVTGIGSRNVKMTCLYSGNPTPTVDWRRKDGSLPFGRYEKSNSGTTITLLDLREEDEGVYICSARSGQDEESQEVHLKVDWEPKFENNIDMPSDHNATEGDVAVFKCRTYAEPEANTQWYINGEPIYEGATGNPRYSITEGGIALEVQKVCKDCPDGAESTDLMNVQCNSSNEHSYAYADAYLNILLETKIIVAPENVQFEWGNQVEFKCEAESDDSTPVQYLWEKNDVPIQYEPGRIEITEDNSLLITTKNDDDSGKSFLGVYTCIADNQYSMASESAELLEPSVVAPIKGAGVGDFWWIFVIIAIILLLLILLCCCCLCIQRNKGDSYPVDEKERANGNDPEKELADSGFSDYQRPEDAPIKGSRASLSSTIKLDSEDEGSLNEYGDIDTGKFNEDGSFIGQYIEKDKKRPKDSDV